LGHDTKQLITPLRTATPVLGEHVRATLSPLLSPGSGTASSRPSADFGEGRRSMDLNAFSRRSVDLSKLNMDGPARSSSQTRRSFSRNRREEKRTSEKQGSS